MSIGESGLDGVLTEASLNGSPDVQPVKLAILAKLLQHLLQSVDVVDMSLAALPLLLANVGSDSLLAFAHLRPIP